MKRKKVEGGEEPPADQLEHDGEATRGVVMVSDAAADVSDDLPAAFTRVGQVVHWGQGPSFTEVPVQLEPEYEVRPGQFLGVWHGLRGRGVLTVIQVGNCFEVN